MAIPVKSPLPSSLTESIDGNDTGERFGTSRDVSETMPGGGERERRRNRLGVFLGGVGERVARIRAVRSGKPVQKKPIRVIQRKAFEMQRKSEYAFRGHLYSSRSGLTENANKRREYWRSPWKQTSKCDTVMRYRTVCGAESCRGGRARRHVPRAQVLRGC